MLHPLGALSQSACSFLLFASFRASLIFFFSTLMPLLPPSHKFPLLRLFNIFLTLSLKWRNCKQNRASWLWYGSHHSKRGTSGDKHAPAGTPREREREGEERASAYVLLIYLICLRCSLVYVSHVPYFL